MEKGSNTSYSNHRILSSKIKNTSNQRDHEIPSPTRFKSQQSQQSHKTKEQALHLSTSPAEDLKIKDLAPQYEGYMFRKMNEQRCLLKRYYYRLFANQLFVYRHKEDKEQKLKLILDGQNMSLKQIKAPSTMDQTQLFGFAIESKVKSREFFIQNSQQFFTWLQKLRPYISDQSIFLKYSFKNRVGQGKYGIVWRALNLQNGEYQAIKIVQKNKMSTKELKECLDQVRILRSCEHRNIVKFIDFYENSNFLFVIQELLEGETLMDYVVARENMSEYLIQGLIKQIANAIHYLKQESVIHRDIKLTNIMVTKKCYFKIPEIKLLDFGLARRLEKGEKACEPYGTITYAAPQLLLQQPYSFEVDAYSLGVTLYCLIYGRLPFFDQSKQKLLEQAKNVMKIIFRKVVNDDIELNSNDISQNLRQVVKGLMAKNPQKRTTVEQFLKSDWITNYRETLIQTKRRNTLHHTSSFIIGVYATS